MLICTWKIIQLTKQNLNSENNVVLHVIWEKTGIDSDGYAGTCRSSTYFDTSQIDPSLFVPFEELTKEIIVQWIKSVTNEDTINAIILEEIDKVKNNWAQLEEGSFPWEIGGEE